MGEKTLPYDRNRRSGEVTSTKRLPPFAIDAIRGYYAKRRPTAD
jgi:hypothetical protein